jgi:hypothetical protein
VNPWPNREALGPADDCISDGCVLAGAREFGRTAATVPGSARRPSVPPQRSPVAPQSKRGTDISPATVLGRGAGTSHKRQARAGGPHARGMRTAAHFSFWTPWRGGCAGTAGASARYTRGSPNPTELPPRPEPKTGRSVGLHTHPASKLVSTAPRPGPFLRGCALRSFLRCWCSCRWTTPLGHRFPACNGPPAAPAPSAPAPTRGDSIPLEGRLTPPGRWLRFGGGPGSTRALITHRAAASRRSPCAAATSRAPPRSRSVWSAPACWRCRTTARLPQTYCPSPIFQARSKPDPIGCSPDYIYPQRAGFQPGPWVGEPEKAASA